MEEEDSTYRPTIRTVRDDMVKPAPVANRTGSGRVKVTHICSIPFGSLLNFFFFLPAKQKTKVPFDPSDLRVPRRRQTICESRNEMIAPVAKKPRQSHQPVLETTTVPAKRSSLSPCSKCKLNDSRRYLTCKMCPKRRSEYIILIGGQSILRMNNISNTFVSACLLAVHVDCLKEDCSHFSASEEKHWQCDSCQACLICYESSLTVSTNLLR